MISAKERILVHAADCYEAVRHTKDRIAMSRTGNILIVIAKGTSADVLAKALTEAEEKEERLTFDE